MADEKKNDKAEKAPTPEDQAAAEARAHAEQQAELLEQMRREEQAARLGKAP
jgi:hypothetical protein